MKAAKPWAGRGEEQQGESGAVGWFLYGFYNGFVMVAYGLILGLYMVLSWFYYAFIMVLYGLVWFYIVFIWFL